MKTCEACGVQSPVLDEHHVWPIQYGGKMDGKTVAICGNCHKTVHHYERDPSAPPPHLAKLVGAVRLAKQMFSKGMTTAKDSRRQGYVKLTETDEKILDAIAQRFGTRGRTATLSAVLQSYARSIGLIR